jgi:hypothetical protein
MALTDQQAATITDLNRAEADRLYAKLATQVRYDGTIWLDGDIQFPSRRTLEGYRTYLAMRLLIETDRVRVYPLGLATIGDHAAMNMPGLPVERAIGTY